MRWQAARLGGNDATKKTGGIVAQQRKKADLAAQEQLILSARSTSFSPPFPIWLVFEQWLAARQGGTGV
jgi:hypothetical protein